MRGGNPTDLEAQAHLQSEADRKQQALREQEVNDFRWLLAHRQGRRIVWRLLSEAGVFRSTFSMNASEAAWLEGKRNTGLMLIDEIHELCPDRYHEMVTENLENARHIASKRKRQSESGSESDASV